MLLDATFKADDVIHKDKTGTPSESCKDQIHYFLEQTRGVCQNKAQHVETELPAARYERCLLSISRGSMAVCQNPLRRSIVE